MQPSSIRLPRGLDAALRREASRRGISRSRLIEEALEHELFGARDTDDLRHRMLTSLLFLEELLVDASTPALSRRRNCARSSRSSRNRRPICWRRRRVGHGRMNSAAGAAPRQPAQLTRRTVRSHSTNSSHRVVAPLLPDVVRPLPAKPRRERVGLRIHTVSSRPSTGWSANQLEFRSPPPCDHDPVGVRAAHPGAEAAGVDLVAVGEHDARAAPDLLVVWNEPT